MIALLICIITTAAYLAIGYRAAVWNVPGSWQRARKLWDSEDNQRSDVKVSFITMLLFWLVRLPARAVFSWTNTVITAHDPKELERKHEIALARIAELERELGYDEPTDWNK
jgi:hypothetical protein